MLGLKLNHVNKRGYWKDMDKNWRMANHNKTVQRTKRVYNTWDELYKLAHIQMDIDGMVDKGRFNSSQGKYTKMSFKHTTELTKMDEFTAINAFELRCWILQAKANEMIKIGQWKGAYEWVTILSSLHSQNTHACKVLALYQSILSISFTAAWLAL